MSKAIHKFEVQVIESGYIMLPVGAEILSVQAQQDRIQLWAMVDTTQIEKVRLSTAVFGTGHPIPSRVTPDAFKATVQMHNGKLAFHVFVWF